MRAVAVLLPLAALASAQTWCGKPYKKTSMAVDPGGHFPNPGTSSTPLLAFSCAPAIRPYLPEDATNAPPPSDPNWVSFVVDAEVTTSNIANAAAISSTSGSLAVTVSLTNGGTVLASGNLAVGSTGNALNFSLSGIQPSKTPYAITCKAKATSGETYTAISSLYYLPSPPSGIGSVTRMDQRTGALWAKPADGSAGPYAPVIPVGFYTSFDNYLGVDFTIPATLKQQGFNVIHPVPTFSNTTALNLALDAMQKAGIYLMYDTRYTYQDSASVTSQVNSIKSRPNLLLWYTGDEPDGTSDPLSATVTAYNLINSLDGYHPVSLVLNCQDYYFNDYTAGADIVMQDVYMIGNNVTFSSVWGTPCNTTYGDCGCDNCHGSFLDISDRMDQFAQRLWVNGWDRTKAVWTVPQGFGNETYWKRYPTGPEFLVETILGINHGGMGSISWDDPTTSDIKSSASILASALPALTPFIASPYATFKHTTVLPPSGSGHGVDVGMWTVNGETLVLGTNLDYASISVPLSGLGLGAAKIEKVAMSGAGATGAVGATSVSFGSVASGAWVVK